MLSDSYILLSYHFVGDVCVLAQYTPSHCRMTVSSGVEEMPSQNMLVQRLLLDIPCSGLVTHSGKSFKEILTKRRWNGCPQNTTRKWKSCHRLHGVIKKNLQTKRQKKSGETIKATSRRVYQQVAHYELFKWRWW